MIKGKIQKTKSNRRKKPHPGATHVKVTEFENYALFLALPLADRKEVFGATTDLQFAKKFNLNNATLSRWKFEPELWEIRDKYLLHFKKHTGKVLGALAKRAERSGEAFHVLSFMKLVEGWQEKSGLDLTSKGQKVSGFEVTIRHAAYSPTTNRPRDKAAENETEG